MSSSKGPGDSLQPGNVLFRVEPFERVVLAHDAAEAALKEQAHCLELPVCSAKSKFSRGSSASGDGKGQGEAGEETFEDRRDMLEREAYEQGFAQGRKDGLDLEIRKMKEKTDQFDALMKDIRGLKVKMFSEIEREVLQLSLALTKRVVRSEVKTNPEIIGKTIRDAMGYIVDKSQIRISIHPEDMEEVSRILPELSAECSGGKFQVVEDRAIERGGCMLETGFGRINATLEEQISMLEQEIHEVFSEALQGEA